MTQPTRNQTRVTFITGTDTGVGKTVFTAHAVFGLRHSGCNALAIKPFCSGGRGDVSILYRAQRGLLTRDEINPVTFHRPLAPLVAARLEGRSIPLSAVIRHARCIGRKCDRLLVEGAGGLLVPLGEGYSALDLAARLRCRVIVVSANRLGTINHTLLTVEHLRRCGVDCGGVVLMAARRKDRSTASNYAILKEFLGEIPVVQFPDLGPDPTSNAALKLMQKNFHKTLASLFA